MASITNEWYCDFSDPEPVIEKALEVRPCADLLTLIQRPPDIKPRLKYPMELDNVAIMPISTFQAWWDHLGKSGRKHIRRAEKFDITTRLVEFNDSFVQGIAEIYNETPLRDGVRARNYGDALETLARKHSTFMDRCDFIGAFCGEELIGFVKLVYAGETARTMNFICKLKHRDKWPMNVLLAKAVEVSVARGARFLIYGKMEYGKAGNPGLAAFKEENGFIKGEYPRYFVPLTLKGKIALALKLHKGPYYFIPKWLVQLLRRWRTRWFIWLHRTKIQH